MATNKEDKHTCVLDFTDDIILQCTVCLRLGREARPIIVLVTDRSKLLLALLEQKRLDPRGKAWKEACDVKARTLDSLGRENFAARALQERLEAEATRQVPPEPMPGPDVLQGSEVL